MEKIYETENEATYRFQCDCFCPHCALDITVDKNMVVKPTFSFWSVPESIKSRLIYCWKMLTTGKGFEQEFILREEDRKNLKILL